MKVPAPMRRRDFAKLLAWSLPAVLVLRSAGKALRGKRAGLGSGRPSSREGGHRIKPPRIPEKPFREEDLWSPHDYAG